MIIPVGFAQLNFRFEGIPLPRTAECTIGVSLGAGVGNAGDVAEAAFDAWVTAVMADAQTSATALTAVTAKIGPNDVGPVGFFGGLDSGNNTGTAAPPQVAAICRKLTDFGGRQNRGRFYIPSIPESEITENGTLTPFYHSAIFNRCSTFFDELTANGLSPVVLHGGAAFGSPTLCTGFRLEVLVATQRRRLRG